MFAGDRLPAGPGYSTVLPTLDFETYSEAGYIQDPVTLKWHGVTKTAPGLPAVGAPVYSEHPSTLVLSLAYDLKAGQGPQLWTPDCPPPIALFQHIWSGGLLEAWNSAFEYHIWLNVCYRRMGWPNLPYQQLRDAMAKSRAYSLPGKLEKAAEVLRAVEQKSGAGKALIRKLSVQQPPTAKRPGGRCTDPQALAELYAYNVQDIRAESSVSELCPDLSADELQVWLLDQEINFRGVHIDQAALQDCISIVRQAEAKYTAELQHLTGGTVQTAGELAKLTGWLGANGCHMGSLDADSVTARLERTDVPPVCRRVLEIRQVLGSASVKKLFAIERHLSADGRLKDLFAYYGADRTGRWAGHGPQPQNMPGGKPTEIVDQILAVMATCNLTAVEAAYGDPVTAVSDCLRGLFSAAPGCDLICSDFSAIEAVVMAFMSGEQWQMDVFNTHCKIYEATASKITGQPVETYLTYKKENDKHHPHRKLGKVASLASQYGGGLGAWKAFGADVFMTDEEIQDAVKAWRLASPAITGKGYYGEPLGYWYGLQGAAFAAVENPGHCYQFKALTFGVKNDVLYCRLPSGRNLTYHTPRLEMGTMSWGKATLRLTYMGWNSNYFNGPVGWMKLDTYGPKIAENVTQAVARDILAYSMVGLAAAGYPIVLHVHDEVIAEVPVGWGSVEEFERIMGRMPPWAVDAAGRSWPVKAAGGWRGRRYRKE
jgi:DNA polymerase